ncbi:MAG: class I SAM-dependent methyltransferase [Gemmatimonadota bacterium]
MSTERARAGGTIMLDHRARGLTMPDPSGYVLRPRDRAELERLRHQHEVWSEPTAWALDRASVGPGHRVADLGCGPGFLALELGRRVGPEGRVLGVETSPLFVESLRSSARDLPWVTARCRDIRETWGEPGTLDAVFCRWVLMFLPDPERVIERARETLRPGGRFVAMEYANFRSMSLHPRGDAFARTYRARCSSVPKCRRTVWMAHSCAPRANVSPLSVHPYPRASMRREAVRRSCPDPPYRPGTTQPSTPKSAQRRQRSASKSPAASRSMMRGSSSSSANRTTEA